MNHSSSPQAVSIRFALDIELYAFALFVAPHRGYASAESYIAALLAHGITEGTGAQFDPVPFTVPADNVEDFRADDRGVVNVSIPVRQDHHDHAQRHFAADGFFSAADYLQGLLNAVLMEAMTAYEDRAATGADWRPLWLREYLASCDTEWNGDDPPAGASDLDADLPF